MVDLTQYAHSLESDLSFVRGMLARLEAGTMHAGMRARDKQWVDFTAQTILLYKRMIVTYDAALTAVKTRLAAGEGMMAGVDPLGPLVPPSGSLPN
jgi:uncharacterized protein YhjY with autotransporter beta-barrel domain